MVRKKRCFIALFLALIVVISIPITIFTFQEKEEVIKDLKTFKFKDLSIVSAQKPKNTHLFVETSDGNLWLADSVDPAKLYYSIDKGDNWILKTTRLDKIKMFYYDRTNERLYAVDGTTAVAGASSRQFYIDISDTGTPYAITEGDIGGGNDEMHDIIWDGTRAFAMKFIRGGANIVVFFANEFNDAFVDQESTVDVFDGKTFDMTPGVVIGGFDWFLYHHEDANVELWKYEIAADGWTNVEDCGGGTSLPAKSLQGIAYDGSDILYFVLVVGGVNKLYSYVITTDTLTQISLYNVSLMLDRNNVGTAPNEFEKGFSIDATETVYEIKARRGGVRVLQDMSAITDAVIIAITDNFLMNNDGDMFEFTDVESEVSSIRYNDGIIGVLKKGVFTVHPDFHANWSKGDSIKIYDANDVLEFHGLITDKNRNRRGIYVFKIDSFTNEIYRKTYEKTYSGDDTDTKQKDVIDNACDFCYRSSSIVGTTTNYDYAYNRAVIYLFWLARFLERQVPYVEPDGKIFTKAYNGLAATGKSWDINDNSQEVFLIDIPGLEERLQGFFDGNSGITRNTIRYKNNASTVRPVAATRDPIEQLRGILPLNEFRDSKLEAATEANQLGDNRYNIWSIDTIFLGLRIEGQGYLQPGKTIQIQNTGEITIAQDDFLILSFERDPKNDVYSRMILSDNIIFPTEFKNLQNTTITQVHNASVQAIENQGALTTHAGTDSHNGTYYTEAEVDALLAALDLGEDNTVTKREVHINPTTGAAWAGDRIEWDAVGERLYINFRTDAAWDDSLDLHIMLFVSRQDANNDTVAYTKYAKGGADGTDLGAWNVYNAVASSLAASVAGKVKEVEVVLAAADWTAGHAYNFLLIHNEAGRDFHVFSARIVVEA